MKQNGHSYSYVASIFSINMYFVGSCIVVKYALQCSQEATTLRASFLNVTEESLIDLSI